MNVNEGEGEGEDESESENAIIIYFNATLNKMKITLLG